MSIVYNENKKTFSLHTAKTTYQLKIGNLNYVNHLYYGATIRDEDLSYLIRRYDRGFSGNPYDFPQGAHLLPRRPAPGIHHPAAGRLPH